MAADHATATTTTQLPLTSTVEPAAPPPLRALALGHFILFFMQCVYSAYAVLSSVTFRYLGVEVLLSLRFVSGLIQVVAICLAMPESRELALQPWRRTWPATRDFLILLLLGVLSMVVNVYLYLLGIKFTGPVTTSAFQCTTSAASIIISGIFGYERVTVFKVVAILLAIGGDVLVLKIWTVQVTDQQYIYGILCLIGNVTSFSFFLVFIKRYFRMFPMFYVLSWLFAVGVVGTSILSVTVGSPSQWRRLGDPLPTLAVVGVVYYTVLMGALPYMLNAWAFRFHMTPALTTLYASLQPMLTVLLNWAVQGSFVDGIQGAGIALVVIAVAIGAWAQHRETAAAAALLASQSQPSAVAPAAATEADASAQCGNDPATDIDTRTDSDVVLSPASRPAATSCQSHD